MKIAIGLFCAALLFATSAPSYADERAELQVRVSDLDLNSDDDINVLATRFSRKFKAICGSYTDFGLTYANTGGGLKERADCKANLRLGADAPDGVKRAFKIALERML